MKTISTFRKASMIVLTPFLLVACQKEVEQRTDTVTATAPIKVTGFHVDASKVELLQGNANSKALTLGWETSAPANAVYTVEAALNGQAFDEMVELGSTDQQSIQVTVQDLNRKICQLVMPGNTAMVALRVRANRGHENTAATYGDITAVQVTTYLDYVTCAQFMKVPGNFEAWVIGNAPTIVDAKSNGEYEGYVNFNIPYPEFLFVKGDQWTSTNTFTNIGSGKFGFGGDILSAKEGTGNYLVKVNTNTNKWVCTKVKTWGIHGTAVTDNAATDPTMTYDAENGIYDITLNLQKGIFRFRANNSDALSLGYTMKNGYKIPDAGGADFVIDKPGTYQLKLNVKLPGNYVCGIVKGDQSLVTVMNTKP